jgi:hypothetical protein
MGGEGGENLLANLIATPPPAAAALRRAAKRISTVAVRIVFVRGITFWDASSGAQFPSVC